MSIKADTYGDPHAGADSTTDGSAAARLLEITARETDQWRADARNEADAVVTAARRESEELLRAARAEAERVVADARAEAYRVREEIAELEGVANEQRERMRRHLTEMLDRIDHPGQ